MSLKRNSTRPSHLDQETDWNGANTDYARVVLGKSGTVSGATDSNGEQLASAAAADKGRMGDSIEHGKHVEADDAELPRGLGSELLWKNT